MYLILYKFLKNFSTIFFYHVKINLDENTKKNPKKLKLFQKRKSNLPSIKAKIFSRVN